MADGVISFRPFLPEHLARIDLPPDVAAALAPAGPADLARLVVPGLSWTGFVGDNPVGAAGVYELWSGRAMAWALFGRIPRRAWPSITVFVNEVLAHAHVAGYARIEASVAADFKAGLRWAERLGFALETPAPARKFGPDGSDHFLYARVTP